MLVILDTNILFSDPLLSNAHAISVRDAAAHLGYSLNIPEVVFNEAVGKWRERAEAFRAKAQSAHDESGELEITWTGNILSANDVLISVSKYTSKLETIFPASTRLTYPAVSHADVMARAVSKRRPFTERDKGYRDTLIWLSILEFLAGSTETVVFICRDGDFRKQKGHDDLHPDLEADLVDLGVSPGSVRLFKDLGGFMVSLVSPQLEELAELKEEIQSGSIAQQSNLESHVEDFLAETVTSVHIGSFKEFEEYMVDVIEDVYMTAVLDVRKLPGGDVFVRSQWICAIALSTDLYDMFSVSPGVSSAVATIDLVLDAQSYSIKATELAELDVDYPDEGYR